MTEQKKLSERVRRGDFAEWRGKDIDGYPDYRLSPSRIADEIANLEQRLAEAEAENAELRSFVDEVEGNVVDAIEAATEDMQENTHD